MVIRKAVVIGLDGVPHSLIMRFADAGIMPKIGEIIKRGTLIKMKSTFPPISAVAWTSFMTGSNPGRHGIFGFTELDKKNRRLRFPGYSQVKIPTLWDIVGKHGGRSVIINMPSTYPARPINGVMISGFVAPRLEYSVYPAALLGKLKEMNYRIDVDAEKGHKEPPVLIREAFRLLEMRKKIFEMLWDIKWDLFCLVITSTDRLHHFFWSSLENEKDPYYSSLCRYYEAVDNLIGDIYERTPDKSSFFMLSDHGFDRLEYHVYLNSWLEKEGYLTFRDNVDRSLENISPETRAFCLDPARVYINIAGQQGGELRTNGGQHQELLSELSLKLRNMVIEIPEIAGRRARTARPVASVRIGKDIYKGPYLDRAPDLISEPAAGFDLKGMTGKNTIVEKPPFTGKHTRKGAFFYVGWKIKKSPNSIEIIDCMPTILKTMGIALPDSIDGKPVQKD